MNIVLKDGEKFPRGMVKVGLLSPCAVCKKKYMDNYPPRYPVWSKKHNNLVCRDCRTGEAA